MATKHDSGGQRHANGRKAGNHHAKRQQLRVWLLAGSAFLLLLVLAVLFFWPRLFSINGLQEGSKTKVYDVAKQTPNENILILKPGVRVFIENGYSLLLEDSRGCTPEADGSINVNVLNPAGRVISSSYMWFGGFSVEHAGSNKFFLVVAINGLPRGVLVDSECLFGNGLKNIENVSIAIS